MRAALFVGKALLKLFLYSGSQCGIGHIFTGRWRLYHNRYPELFDGA